MNCNIHLPQKQVIPDDVVGGGLWPWTPFTINLTLPEGQFLGSRQCYPSYSLQLHNNMDWPWSKYTIYLSLGISYLYQGWPRFNPCLTGMYLSIRDQVKYLLIFEKKRPNNYRDAKAKWPDYFCTIPSITGESITFHDYIPDSWFNYTAMHHFFYTVPGLPVYTF